MRKTLILVLVTAAATGPLRAQANPDSIVHENHCRLAEQALTTGHPATKVDWARSYLSSCGGGQWARAVVAVLDRLRTSNNVTALSTEWHATTWLRDAGLFGLTERIAADPAASVPSRLF